jgi:hypothetical protein
MSIWEKIFGYPAINRLPSQQKQEVKKLLDELVKIGKLDDYLSLQPGGPFNVRCHHTGARKIGERLNEIGGLDLMWAARAYVKDKLKTTLAEHLDYCWQDIGEWQA